MKLSSTSLVQFATKLGVTGAGFVSTFVFARLLGSDVLGMYFLVVALIGWLEFGSQLGLTTAIQKRVSELEDPGSLLSAGGVLLAGVVLLVLVSVVVGRSLIDSYVGRTGVGLLVAVMLVGKMVFVFADSGLRGAHRVATAATLDFTSTLLRVIFQVFPVLVGFGLSALLIGYAAGFAVTGLVGLYVLFSEIRPKIPSRGHLRQIVDYARYSWLTVLKSRVSASLDTIVLGFFVTNSLVGIYGASWNLAIILALASQSLYSALFPALSRLSATDEMTEFQDILSEALIYAGIVPFPGVVGLAVVGSDVLRIYGSAFPRGATVVVVLGVFALLSSYEGQLRIALDAIDRPELTFRINALFVATNIVGNVILVALFDMIGAAVATTVSMGLSLAYAYALTDRLIGIEVPTAELLRQVLAAGVMGVVVVLVERVLAPLPYYFVVVSIGVGVTVYFATLLIISTTIREKATVLIADWRAA